MKISTRLIAVVLASLLTLLVIPCQATTTSTVPSIDEFIQQMDESNQELVERQEIAHQMAECARYLGYPEECETIQTAQMEWWLAQNEKTLNTENDKWYQKYEEYPAATYIWLYLTQKCEYSPYVAAGIIGNIRAEVGGGTLNLQYWLYDSSGYYYGMCQWNRGNYAQIHGADLATQCEFLSETIEYEIDTFGYAYARGYKYADFLALENARSAALMFAKSYERCGSGSYSLRQDWAEDTYNYFMN